VEVKKEWVEEVLQKQDKKAKKTPNDLSEIEDESDRRIIGKWSKEFVPAELDSYPRFIGQAQKDPSDEVKKASSVFALISEALGLLREVRKINGRDGALEEKWLKGRKDNSSGLLHKNLEVIKSLAARYKNKDHLLKSKSFEFIEDFVDLDNTNSQEQKEHWRNQNLSNVKFYVSGYEYRNKEFLAVTTQNFADYLNEFESHFDLDKLQDDKQIEGWLGFQGGNISWFTSERGEILKIYFSLLLRDLPKKIALPDYKNIEQLANTTLSSLLFKDNKLNTGQIDLTSLQRFFAASVGSEIRSKLSTLSRKDFIKRNVIQITNGSQSFLQYVPIEWGDFSHLEKSLSKHKIKKIKSNASEVFSERAKAIFEKLKIDYLEKPNHEIVADIWARMSKANETEQRLMAQILGEIPHRWEMVLKTKQPLSNIQEVMKGFFIEKSNDKNIFDFCTSKKDHLYSFPIQTSVYQKQFLERFLWGDRDQDGQMILSEKILGGTVIIESLKNLRSGDESNFTLYYAIPCQLSKDGERLEKGEEHHRISVKQKKNIIGIDLGEYGFGWAVFNPESQTFIASGFQAVPLLKKMRDSAANWKDTQASGIFSRPTTHLAKMRKKAAGQTRNQIHRLAIKHGAKPIYEDSVDGFESGGKRVSKLYKTLKTADVIAANSNKADQIVRKHFWGTEFSQIGGVIGAAKTSQTCRSCGRCKTSEIEAKIKSATGDEKQRLEEEWLETKKDQRSFLTGKEKERGSGARFICQCDDCPSRKPEQKKEEVDADKQAAQNIALKYYFKITASDEEQKKYANDKGQFSSLKYFLAKSQKFC
jgi:hypothetical protein